ncbi:MAG TPA: hypothetical protein VH092_35535 [Urbifossiella sp.]|nr:hypothetical protein [Urbifossiella sp.]
MPSTQPRTFDLSRSISGGASGGGGFCRGPGAVPTVGVSVTRSGWRAAVFSARPARARRYGPAPRPSVRWISSLSAPAIRWSSSGRKAAEVASAGSAARASLAQARCSRSVEVAAWTRR